MDAQTLVALLLVALAAAALLRQPLGTLIRLFRPAAVPPVAATSGCGGCSGCPASVGCGKKAA